MQIKPGFAMRKIAGSNIVVPVGAASSDFNGMITTTEAQVVEALMHEYEVERQRAAADVAHFAALLRENDLLAE